MRDRTTLLKELDEVSFAINDLTLFLDTHPDCREAIEEFHRLSPRRKELMQQYAETFEPLTVDCAGALPAAGTFSWANGPAPWEGGVL